MTRSAELDDANAISKLLRVVFAEAYGHVLDSNVLKEHLETYLSEKAIRSDMTSSSYYLVEDASDVVGVLKLCLDDELKPEIRVEIAKLYVLEEVRSQGVGSKLIDAALTWSKEKDASSIWLNVWQENKKAVQFYEKHDFIQVGFSEVYVGEVVFDDYVMERAIERVIERVMEKTV